MTQISEAKRGKSTSQMKDTARCEKTSVELVRKGIAAGQIVIPWNPIHAPVPLGIGKGLRVKVNANIGTSREHCSLKEEVEKAQVAVDAGAHAVMDLSTGGDLNKIRRSLLKTVMVPFGTVPIYQAGIEAIEKRGSIVDMNEDDMFSMVESQAKQGVDFVVVHVGVTKESVERLRKQKRLIPMVSRGGSFHMAWILHHDQENPFYKDFNSLLEIAKNYDVTLSLGDGMRSGALTDSNDRAKFQELLIIGELVEKVLIEEGHAKTAKAYILYRKQHQDMREIGGKSKPETTPKADSGGSPYSVINIIKVIAGALLFLPALIFDPMLIAVLADGRWICLGTWYE